MNILKWNRIFFPLICLTLMFVLTIGNVNTSRAEQSETDFATIDAYITEQMNDLGIPGMALGIVQGDQIIHLGGFGVADSSGRKVTPQTPFHIGSTTKSFTTLAVMQLVEAGKIDLDAPVKTYLPWFELDDKEASAKITVRNLLNQTTGISNKDGNRLMSSQQGLEEVVRGFNIIQLTQPVGGTWQYSNLNYYIAGLIVEQVSGQSYADYVTQSIFEPLDMRHSYASRAPALADGLAEGHRYMFGHAFRLEKARPPAALPAGFLIASVEDLSHYAIAQLNDGRYGDSAILSPQGIAELHAPAIPIGGNDHYAMGWFVSTWDGLPIVYNPGDDGRYLSIVTLMPDRGSGVVLLANASGFEQWTQVTQIAKGVVSLLNNKPPAPISLPFPPIFLYWTILLTPVLMILGIAYSWRYSRRHSRNKGAGHILLTVILYGGVALLWLFGLDPLMGVPIWTVLPIDNPELAYSLIAGAVLGIGWSIIYTAMSLRARRSK
jgi:CubicO group peptidase (beta-lactamase class C family)